MRLVLISIIFIIFHSFAYANDELAEIHDRVFSLLYTDPDEAYRLAIQAESMAHEDHLYAEEANYLFVQAFLNDTHYLEQGKAFILYLKALEVVKPHYQESEKSLLVYRGLLMNTGNILKDHYAYDQAMEYYDNAIKLYSPTEPDASLVRIYHNRADLFGEMENWEEAIKSIDEAIYYAGEIKDEKMILSTLNFKGLLQVDMGQFEAARGTFNEILNLDFIDKHVIQIGVEWHNIGHSYADEKRYKEAIEGYKQAEKYKIENLRPEAEIFITWTDLCEMHKIIGDFKTAMQYGLKAEQQYEHLMLHPENYRIFEYLSHIAFELGDYRTSKKYTDKYMEENAKFIEIQRNIQKVKDQYKMEVLAAGFFVELNSSKNDSIYTIILTIVSSIFTIILLAGLGGQYFVRRSIRKSIQRIERDSLV